MRFKTTQLAIPIIFVHAAITALHGVAHQKIRVFLPFWQNIFVLVDILMLPLVAGVLLWRRFYQGGHWLLSLSMAGAFIFGAYSHFWAESPDHVANVPAGRWGALFRLTSVLLFISEGLGAWIGWRGLAKSTDSVKFEPVEGNITKV